MTFNPYSHLPGGPCIRHLPCPAEVEFDAPKRTQAGQILAGQDAIDDSYWPTGTLNDGISGLKKLPLYKYKPSQLRYGRNLTVSYEGGLTGYSESRPGEIAGTGNRASLLQWLDDAYWRTLKKYTDPNWLSIGYTSTGADILTPGHFSYLCGEFGDDGNGQFGSDASEGRSSVFGDFNFFRTCTRQDLEPLERKYFFETLLTQETIDNRSGEKDRWRYVRDGEDIFRDRPADEWFKLIARDSPERWKRFAWESIVGATDRCTEIKANIIIVREAGLMASLPLLMPSGRDFAVSEFYGVHFGELFLWADQNQGNQDKFFYPYVFPNQLFPIADRFPLYEAIQSQYVDFCMTVMKVAAFTAPRVVHIVLTDCRPLENWEYRRSEHAYLDGGGSSDDFILDGITNDPEFDWSPVFPEWTVRNTIVRNPLEERRPQIEALCNRARTDFGVPIHYWGDLDTNDPNFFETVLDEVLLRPA